MNHTYIGKTCPYCQFPLKADSEVVQCPSCKVPHHRECWAENGGCTTFGCRETTYQSAAADRLEISFDETSGRESSPASGGGINKLLAAALVVSLLVSIALLAGYIMLLNSRVDEIADIAGLDADYYIDYENGTIPIGDLPIGARVVDPGWVWEYRLGVNCSDIDWDGDPTPPGEVKPVTWIVVAKDHYEGLDPHVTLLTEELIGLFAFDDSTDRDHEAAEYGYNHWGDSGTANATLGLRPWLNSTGIHSGKGFYQAFSDGFKGAILATTVSNKEWNNGTAYSTKDYVFIPSTTELGDEDHDWTYRIGDVYAYFYGVGEEKRIAMMVGDGWNELVKKLVGVEQMEEWGIYGNSFFYWTRSPESRYDSLVCEISPGGGLEYFPAYGHSGVLPALNLKAVILVSEIRN